MRKFGCLSILLVIAFLCLEVWVVQLVILRVHDVLGPILLVVATSIVGVKILQYQLKRLPQAIVGGNLGRRLVGVIGAVFIIVPGFISDALGLLLLLPPVQALLAGVGTVIGASLAKRTMGRMFGGGMFPPGGAPGGFPGFPGGFPQGGFPALKPDDQLPFGRPGPKTYDVKPEKD
jgi:UPF0716 family protein affecting phage T7 exclusion